MTSIGPTNNPDFARTGIEGFDDIMGGGFTRGRLYLLEGVPGSGKTTLSVQFLLEGTRQGESVLYVTLSETEEELRSVAKAHNWCLDGIKILELVPAESKLNPDDQYTVFHPSEVEMSETLKVLLSEVEQLKPMRVVIDSLSELRLLSGSPLHYRRQILALKQFFSRQQCTVLLLDDMTTVNHDLQVQSIAHGVVRLEQLYPEFGAERRRLIVIKYRGVKFRGGYHDYIIRKGGLEIFPRLIAREHYQAGKAEKLPSGLETLDTMLGGGLDRGTSTLIIGAAGTGKSSLSAQIVATAAKQGDKSALFIFDESVHNLLIRSKGLGIDLKPHVDSGLVTVQQVDPAELSPGEFAYSIRKAVEENGARVIIIDSLNGYLAAMPGERFLIIQLHEILTYLGQSGVVTLLMNAQRGLLSRNTSSPVDVSYLSDTVILLRYIEAQNEIRQVITVIKKRTGKHARYSRELLLDNGKINIGGLDQDISRIITDGQDVDGP